MTLLWILASVPGALAVDCPVDAAGLVRLVEASEVAFAALDGAALTASIQDIDAGMLCMSDVVPAALAARTHRAAGFASFVSGDRLGAKEAFTAARNLEPGYQIPAALLPARHPLRLLYAEADKLGGPQAPLVGDWVVDGIRSSLLPLDRPAVIQRLGADGSVLFSARSTSVRAATVVLSAAEAAIPAALPDRPEEGRALLESLDHVWAAQQDCPTKARARYDRGVLLARLGDAKESQDAFAETQNFAESCSPEYAQRARVALRSLGPARRSDVRVKPRYDRISLGLAVTTELGAHDQSRYAAVLVDETGDQIATSTTQRQVFGAGVGVVTDVRIGLGPCASAWDPTWRPRQGSATRR